MRYHGPGSPGGVAHGFKVHGARAAAARAGRPAASGARSRSRRRSAARARATPSSSSLRAVSDGRYRSTPGSRGRSADGRASASCSTSRYRGREVVLGVREGFVTEEFLTLARTPDPTAGQTARLDALKLEMAERVMASPADAVYEQLG